MLQDKFVNTVTQGDIFDIDFDKKEAFVGVLIAEKENRQKGLASIAIELVENEGVKLGLERLKCVVHPGNTASVQLFEKRGFVKIYAKNLSKVYRSCIQLIGKQRKSTFDSQT